MPEALDFFELFLEQRNKIEFEDIKIFYRNLGAPKQWINPKVYALDTETLNGYTKLITDNTGRTLYLEGKEENPFDLLNFLTYKNYRDSLNFWYNLQYDFDSIVKHLPEENIKDLVTDGKTLFNDYKIKYIPKKLFTISKSKHSYTFYDVAQFYGMSLEKAAYLYLGGIKNPDNLNRYEIGTNPAYWKENKEAIIKYCILDSELTAGLGEHLVKTFNEDIGFSPARYVSKASIAKQYFRTFSDIPFLGKIPETALYYAFNSYYGGRFEIIERGDVGKCTLIDINSAYPYEIANLLDVSKGSWKLVNDWHEEAYYGFYKALISVPYQNICPMPFKKPNGAICYPVGQWIGHLTLQEIKAYEPYMNVEIIRGYEFYPKVISYPFKDAINDLYARKQAASKEDFKYSLYKILMNSIYGCFYEKIKQPEGKHKAGVLFNPVYASLITAGTRIKEFLEAQKYGKKCIGFATDSLLIKGELPKIKTDILGDFSTDAIGKTTVIRAGIYKIGDKTRNRGIKKPESRGFKKAIDQDKDIVAPNPKNAGRPAPYCYRDPLFYADLYEYIKEQPERIKYPILSYRPMHLKESVRKATLTVKDINVFMPIVYDIDLNTDFKRVWDSDWLKGGDIFKKRVKSKPLYMEK